MPDEPIELSLGSFQPVESLTPFRMDSRIATEKPLPYAAQNPRRAAHVTVTTPDGSYESSNIHIDEEAGEIIYDLEEKVMSTQKKCYTYARISTQMKTDSSLDAQREQLRREAERRGMAVAAEFSDVGPSGDRPQFAEMIGRIQDGNPDGVACVLVTKLSRFCRDTTDVLSNFQIMQEHGVNLIADDEGIDTATEEGKLMFPVLGGVAALGREASRT